MPSHDWSERYQPVSYSVERSRSGTRRRVREHGESLQGGRCRDHRGRRHQPHDQLPEPRRREQRHRVHRSTSIPGSTRRRTSTRPARSTTTRAPPTCRTASCFSLPDLNTGLASVRQKIADYLIAPGAPGRRGLPHRRGQAHPAGGARRHHRPGEHRGARPRDGRCPTSSSSSSVGRAKRSRRATTSAWATPAGAPPTSPNSPSPAWATSSAAWAASASRQLNPNGPSGSRFSEAAWGLMPSDKAVVFLQNHDTQHSCGIGYRDGDIFRLANVWMLAQPYGYPSVLSSFALRLSGGELDGAAIGCRGQHRDVVAARRVSRRRSSASGSASTATRRSGPWCGSGGRSPART